MECVSDLVVVTDCLRLKQIILNLAIYALKSVQRGFIRLRVETLNNNVLVVVEDSGPGIAMEKRGRLFANFRESLDIMDQGAGMGISLSKHLAQLIGGDVFLDETFISGVEGCPGTRFVVDLKREPLFAPDPSSKNTTDDIKPPQPSIGETIPQPLEDVVSTSIPQVPTKTLPDVLSALFVDDDKVLRKLFVRSLRRVAEGWTVEEATSGEDALSMIETTTFDIIFVDQYMMSATLEKPLLGTETVRAMRSKGIKARICGLSANDVEGDFLENGADLFIKKPYPCEKEALKKTLIRVLYG